MAGAAALAVCRRGRTVAASAWSSRPGNATFKLTVTVRPVSAQVASVTSQPERRRNLTESRFNFESTSLARRSDRQRTVTVRPMRGQTWPGTACTEAQTD